jgi:hypothetical protein
LSYKAAFVLLHKLREAMAEEMKGRKLGGEDKVAEIDGGYFGGYVKPANMKENRRDRRLEAHSLDGACTNWAEEFFSRMRRAEAGHQAPRTLILWQCKRLNLMVRRPIHTIFQLNCSLTSLRFRQSPNPVLFRPVDKPAPALLSV